MRDIEAGRLSLVSRNSGGVGGVGSIVAGRFHWRGNIIYHDVQPGLITIEKQPATTVGLQQYMFYINFVPKRFMYKISKLKNTHNIRTIVFSNNIHPQYSNKNVILNIAIKLSTNFNHDSWCRLHLRDWPNAMECIFRRAPPPSCSGHTTCTIQLRYTGFV